MENTDTSLTSPSDRTGGRPDASVSSLSVEETGEAMKELYVKDFIEKFPKRERAFADPIYGGQVYSLHSFIPSKGAKPDEDGIFGMIKFRGAFPNQQEADSRTSYLIRNVDSYHKIYMGWIGRPFPCSTSSKYSAETKEIDIRKKTTQVVSEDIKQKKEDEKREVDDMKEREQVLLDSSGEEPKEDPLEQYIVLRVKKAQLAWTYLETQKKMDQMRKSILSARTDIAEFEDSDSSYKEQYYEKYMEARRKSGLPDDDESFMKYMGEDLVKDLGF